MDVVRLAGMLASTGADAARERSERSGTMADDLSTEPVSCGWGADVRPEREMMAPRGAVYGRDLGERIGLAFRSDQADGDWAGMAES